MPPPWSGVALVGAFWNCADRAEALLTYLRPWFKIVSIAVQDSPDDTLARVRAIADFAPTDKWHGHGNVSFQKAINCVGKTPFCFLISDDEWPSENLLESMQEQVDRLATEKAEGIWYHFRSSIEGFEFTREQDNHLRLFATRFGWPGTIHSRPMIPMNRTIFWPDERGYIRHDRSLDEMMRDYIRRFEIGRGNKSWEAHNRRMMLTATRAVAQRKGWEWVMGHDWWPQVRSLSYGGRDPDA